MMIINAVAKDLEIDKPYEAMEFAAEYLDTTGMYRLMAILLTG